MTEAVGGSAQSLFRIYLMHLSTCLLGDRGWSSVSRNHSLQRVLKGGCIFFLKERKAGLIWTTVPGDRPPR